MITIKQLEAMNKESINFIGGNCLVELANINIRQELVYHEKVLSFLAEIKNPYCFFCGGVPVRVSFSNNGAKLEKILQNYFIRIKQG